MKKTILPLAMLAVAVYAHDESGDKAVIDPIFGLTAKMEKDAFDNGEHENVSNFFGRVAFGSAASYKNLTGEVVILAYPSGFGYELMRGLQTPEDTAKINPIMEKVARFDVHAAYLQHSGDHFSFGIGRSILFNSNGAFFGNYIDEGPGGYFTGKGVYGNFMKFDFSYDLGATSLVVGSNDSELNTGYLRLFQNFPVLSKKGNIGLGTQTDVLNRVHAPDTAVTWNATVLLDYTINDKVKLYTEVGVTGITEDQEAKVPVLAGVSFPAGKVLDAVSLEMEYLKEDHRQELTFGSVTKKESPVMLGLDIKKDLNKHFRFNAGLYTFRELSEMRGGLSLNMSL